MYEEHNRIVVLGGPRCGKTTFAAKLEKPVRHTDDLILDDVFSSGDAISQWLDQPGPWVIEGVTATLALRSWLKRNYKVGLDGFPVGEEKPCDCVLCLWHPMLRLTYEQRDMLTMLKEKWGAVSSELRRRGVVVAAVQVKR